MIILFNKDFMKKKRNIQKKKIFCFNKTLLLCLEDLYWDETLDIKSKVIQVNGQIHLKQVCLHQVENNTNKAEDI
jgi:hypothetical protein